MTGIERLRETIEGLGLTARGGRLESLLQQASKKEPSYAHFLLDVLNAEAEARRQRYLKTRLQLPAREQEGQPAAQLSVAAEESRTRHMLAVAANTYNTVRLSLNIAELMSDCQAAFRALRNLQVPRLRPFQNWN